MFDDERRLVVFAFIVAVISIASILATRHAPKNECTAAPVVCRCCCCCNNPTPAESAERGEHNENE